MKQKLLNNFRLRAIMLVALLCGAFSGAWADDYVKVTSTDDLTDGTYLIVYENGSLALNGGLTDKLDAVGNTISVTISDGKIASSATVDAAAFTYNATDGTLWGAGGLYMGQTSNANGLQSSATTTYENTISIDGSGDANIVSGGAYLRYNSASNQTRFRYYKSSSYTNQQAIQLYKLEESSDPGDQSVTTTITIDDSYITNTDVYTGTEAGSLSATVSAGETTIDQATITWSGNNDEVATIDASTGVVTLVGAGTVTFTASYAGVENTYKPSSKTYVMTVTNSDPNVPGTENNPYTVAEARAAIDAGTGLAGVYATGIISQVDSYNSTYNSITYWISEDGTTTSDQLEVYSGKGLNNTNFTSVNDVVVGATVVVYGTLKKYGDVYEFDKNNYLTSYSAPAVAVEKPTFSPEAGTYADAQSVTISCETSGATIYYTIDGTDPITASDPTAVASPVYSEPIAVSEDMTIKAIAVKGNESSTVATATYHINSADNPYTVTQALAFSEYPANGVYVSGIVSTAPTQSPTNNGQLTYYISVNGEATNQLQVYKGLGLNEAAFTAQDDIQVGDEVTIYGNVKIYNSTKEFDAGNYLVAFNRPVVVTPTITLEQYEYNLNADGGNAELPVTCSNMPTAPQLAVVFCDANGDAVADGTYNWITAVINNNGNIDGHIDANTGDARTAYFKVTGVDANNNTVYSELVTINQAGFNPSITVNETSVDFDMGSGERTLSFDGVSLGSTTDFDIQFFESDGETTTYCDWISYAFYTDDNKFDINIEYNNTGTARTAYFKVYATVNQTTVYSNLVTVNQSASSAPVEENYQLYTGALTEGDYIIYYGEKAMNTEVSNDRLQYAEVTPQNNVITTSDASIVWHIAQSGEYWTIYNADANAYAAGTGVKNKAQMLEDGTDDKALWTVSGTETYEFVNKANAAANVNANLRNNTTYGFACYATGTGGALTLYKKATNTPSITITPDTYEMDAKAGGGELPVVCANLATDPQLVVVFVEADGETPATYDWISAEINNNGNIDGQITANTGDARTAYFYVQGVDADNNVVKSNLVTFTQQAAVTEPYITVNTGSWDFDVNGGSKTFGFDFANLGESPTFNIQFFESDGITETQCGWISSSFNGDKVTINAMANDEGAARTAYFKVCAEVNKTMIYSNLVTINQAAPVVDYATLPFSWDDTTTPTGVTKSGVGSYSSSPYLKFDGTGDYIILKIDEIPGTLTFDVKGNPGQNGWEGTFTLQTSDDGVEYTDIEVYGALTSDLQRETIILSPYTRYIKWIYTEKVSGNVALGNIVVTAPMSLNLNAYGYATYASEYALDFTNSEADGYSAWEITEINSSNETITFNQITGKVAAKTGVLLKGAEYSEIFLTRTANGESLAGNMLVGITTETAVAGNQYYGLKGNNLVPVNAGNVPAGKALLPMPDPTAAVKAYTFIFNDADGIQTVQTVSAEEAQAIFNLAGQRLPKAQKGINIINGKKVLVK